MRLEQVLGTVVDGLPAEVLVVEGAPPHRLVYQNTAFRATHDFADDEGWTVEGWQPRRRVRDAEGRDVPREELPLLRAIRVRGDVPWRDYEITGDDGRVRHVSSAARALPPGAAQPDLYVQITRDRTDEVEAVRGLARRERLFRSVFDTVPVGIMLADAAGDLITINDAYLRTIGVPRTLLHRSPPFNITRLESYARAGLTDLFVGLLEGRAFRREARITSIVGTEAWVVYTGVPVFDDHGAVEMIIVLLEDVAEQRQAEIRLRQMETMEAAARLAGGMAHDINNTITAVAGYAELLLAQETDLRKRRYLGQVADASAQIARLVQNLSRLRQGAPAADHASVDAAEVAWEAAQAFARSLEVDVQVDIEVTSGALPVLVSRRRLVDVLEELLSNALEAMPEGGHLKVEASGIRPDEALRQQFPALPDGPCARIMVTDTGVGIPEDQVHRIVEPYATTKELGSEKGTGLGLSLVYAFVMEAGGALVVRSREGEGTRVAITLPLAPPGA